MDGIVNVNKPRGQTSYAVVAAVKRIIKQRRVGHGGTLDPLASGVLPVCIGRGTRVVEFLSEARKTYMAEILLGIATNTCDAEGNAIARGNPFAISLRDLEEALKSFRGHIMQRPPMYSAVKHNGRRLYELARTGITVEREMRPTDVYRLELIEYSPPRLRLEVECGKGTYIRSLADDLGQALGCGAHLTGLVRTAYGPFNIDDAVTLDLIEEAIQQGKLAEMVHPLETALEIWPAVTLSDEQGYLVTNGCGLPLAENILPARANAGGRLCAYSQEGHLLAVLRYRAEVGKWHPVKVFTVREAGAVPEILDS